MKCDKINCLANIDGECCAEECKGEFIRFMNPINPLLKKPKDGTCPFCRSRHIYVATLMSAECFKYCGDCGQALDWSEEE